MKRIAKGTKLSTVIINDLLRESFININEIHDGVLNTITTGQLRFKKDKTYEPISATEKHNIDYNLEPIINTTSVQVVPYVYNSDVITYLKGYAPSRNIFKTFIDDIIYIARL